MNKFFKKITECSKNHHFGKNNRKYVKIWFKYSLEKRRRFGFGFTNF